MRLYNSLTRKKEEFIPLKAGEVRFYSCGLTVYNYFHIGNARPFIIFDALRSYLEYLGNKVMFVQNFTDVDDKILINAAEAGITPKELSEKYIEEYYKDAHALGIRDATFAPKATETIDDIIDFIKVLVDKGFAYNIDGNVYFRTKKFAEYGKLSHLPMDDLLIGARIEVGDEKEQAVDFVLWKKPKSEDEIAWDSPWGKGRPGWHIECSAMAKKYLGATIDIHAGGQDLVFPHHENEIAQSEAANEAEFARYWLHNGMINIDNQKMGKSKGNFFTIRDILQEVKPEVVRFFMLSAHYRSPINFSYDLLKSAENGLERIKTCIETLEFLIANRPPLLRGGGIDEVDDGGVRFSEYKSRFLATLDDDFNTAAAISVIFDLVRDINTMASEASKETLQTALDLIHELCGILRILPVGAATGRPQIDDEIQKLINERDLARQNKDWAKSDEIRDLLAEKGIVIKDTPKGTQIICN
ncbi:MAG: cysteine--tRNA ligase [Oscillospiraceae bacterium]|nr:cysteine--tRNA ligase [Oscillospiraceae bacterium]